MAGNVLQFPLIGVEDTLTNIGALTKFALFTLENTDEQEYSRIKAELVTMFYLIQDQVGTGQSNMTEHARRRSERKRRETQA